MSFTPPPGTPPPGTPPPASPRSAPTGASIPSATAAPAPNSAADAAPAPEAATAPAQAGPPGAHYPSFADGPPAAERGRASAVAALALLLGVAAPLVGFGPVLRVTTGSGAATVSGYVLPQALLVIACVLFAGLVAGLSTLPRLKALRGATPVLHAVATAAATVGALLAAFALIVAVGVSRPADLVGGGGTGLGSATDPGTDLAVTLGWAGIALVALAVATALAAFVALAYDLGLVQTRRTVLLAPGPLPSADAPAPRSVIDTPAPASPAPPTRPKADTV